MNFFENTKYILLSKRQVGIRQSENHFENEDLEEWLGIDESTTEDIDNVLLNNTMKQVLTEREYSCVKLMVIEGLSSAEAAKLLGISRQTVNENKNRGLNKLKAALL